MENSLAVLGVLIMVLGVALVIVAIFRALGHTWSLGVHELWALPVSGFALILLGRWLSQ